MKKKIFYLILIMFVSCKENTNNSMMLTDGISAELASYRKHQISNIKYNLFFSIPLKKEDPIPSKVNLELSIHHLDQALILDFKSNKKIPQSAIVNGKKIPIEYKNEHLIIPANKLVLGINTITIDFIAGEMSLNRNADYLFTLLVPDRARTLFPCIDQPDLKATYTLKISAPKEWEVLCGSPVESKKEEGSITTVQFKESDKMSTYLFSFVTGKFEVVNSVDIPFKMHMLHQEKDQNKIDLSTPEIFNLHQKAIDYLEEYTNYKFPFQKLDFAAIYTHPYGGMEHTGAIQYRQTSLFLDQGATQNQELKRAKLISHETSHMWFGNLVTMKWFDDVWLKEVFANFFADKIINPNFDKINHELYFFVNHYPSAYEIDRGKGANPIRQKLDNLNNAGSLYGNIIYDKAPIMMRQLEVILGKDKFQEGIREYIHTYANKNANWNDLVQIFDKKSPLDIQKWSNVWVSSPGRPIIKSNIAYNNKNKIQSFTIEQSAEDNSTNIWPQKFDISLVYSDSIRVVHVDLKNKKTQLPSTNGLAKPNYIIYNSNGLGYGVFPYADSELKAVSDVKDDVSRAVIYLNCYENTLNGSIPILTAFDIFQQGLKGEHNEQILSLISGQLTHLYWTFLTKEQRMERQETIEEILFSRLQMQEKPNIKKTLFNSFKSMAHTGVALDKLYSIWSKKNSIPNLVLNKDDYTSTAMQLILYKHHNASKILTEARDAIKYPNKLERFDFLKPALSNNKNIRIQFFKSFANKEHREKESWVLSACYFIHHPVRQDTAIETLDMSLNLLEEIQQTGDIFFPKSWLDNTIGMYSSKEAYNILNTFIDTHPQLNPQLKLKVLQATNDLFIIQKLNETH